MRISERDGGGLTVQDLEALRGRLTGYCYRLLGSAADTDDAVQETLIRASARLTQYDPARGRPEAWLYRIATNICIDHLRAARRRALLIDPGPARDAGTDLGPVLPADAWVEPMPDARLIDASDPADLVVQRETVRLAFVAALQRLPARQRAVLVLRDVLALSAQECAQVLDTTVAAVNSALQRARAALDADRPRPTDLTDPQDPAQQDLLRRYVAAFEAHDVVGLTALLRDDAIASMPPLVWLLRGGPVIAELTASSDACAGDRLLLVGINGSPGFGQYRPDDDGVLRPFALVAVEVRQGRIGHLSTFLGSGTRFAEFGLPDVLAPDPVRHR